MFIHTGFHCGEIHSLISTVERDIYNHFVTLNQYEIEFSFLYREVAVFI